MCLAQILPANTEGSQGLPGMGQVEYGQQNVVYLIVHREC